MKIITKLLLVSIIASSAISASPFTAIKNHPYATLGILGSISMYIQAAYYQATHKELGEQVKNYEKLTANIKETLRKSKIIPDTCIEQIDSLVFYTPDEKREFKELIGNYNAAVRRYNSNKSLPAEHSDKLSDEVCKIPVKQNRTYVWETIKYKKTTPEITAYYGAQMRVEWSVYLLAATLMGMAATFLDDYAAAHPIPAYKSK